MNNNFRFVIVITCQYCCRMSFIMLPFFATAYIGILLLRHIVTKTLVALLVIAALIPYVNTRHTPHAAYTHYISYYRFGLKACRFVRRRRHHHITALFCRHVSSTHLLSWRC